MSLTGDGMFDYIIECMKKSIKEKGLVWIQGLVYQTQPNSHTLTTDSSKMIFYVLKKLDFICYVTISKECKLNENKEPFIHYWITRSHRKDTEYPGSIGFYRIRKNLDLFDTLIDNVVVRSFEQT